MCGFIPDLSGYTKNTMGCLGMYLGDRTWQWLYEEHISAALYDMHTINTM